MSEIRNLTRNGETFYPLTHEKAVIGMEDFKDTITEQIDNYRPIEITGDVTNAPDEEDITSDANNLLKFKNRNNLYGLGKVILRRGSSFASQVTQSNTIYVIQYNFDLDSARVNIPNGSILLFEGGTLSNGTLVCADLYDVRLVYYQDQSEILSSVTLEGNFIHKACDKDTIREILVDNSSITKDTNDVLSVKASGIQNTHLNGSVVDNSGIALDSNNKISLKDDGVTGAKLNSGIVNTDDLSIVNNKIQLANRGITDGMGMIILRKDLSFASQLTQTNTIYVIRYDYTLTTGVTIPTNSILKFEGGSLSGNITITGDNTGIEAESVRIFNNIILSGTFYNKNINAIWFGVVPGDNTKATLNTDIINNYIINSAVNINCGILFPFDNKLYYFNNTIEVPSYISIICEGVLIYTGPVVNTALKIGSPSSYTTGEYIIKLRQTGDIRSSYVLDGEIYTIPENYGLVMYNAHACNINIVEVYGFAKEVTLCGERAGFAGNTLNIDRIGYYPHYCLCLKVNNNGWVNENLFIGGNYNTYTENPLITSKQCYAIWLLNETDNHTLALNNNIFIKPCCEHFTAPVRHTSYTRDNLFLGLRAEGCYYDQLIDDVDKSRNNVILGNELPRRNLTVGNNRVGTYSDMMQTYKIAQDRFYYATYKVNNIPFYTASVSVGPDGVVQDSSSQIKGYVVNNNGSRITFRTTISSNLGARLYDSNNNQITLTNENKNDYLVYLDGFINSEGYIQSSSTSETTLVVQCKDTVSKILIGSMWGINNINCIFTLYSTIISTTIELHSNINTVNGTITSQSSVRYGDKFWDKTQNKYIYWSGSAWVDATGTPV